MPEAMEGRWIERVQRCGHPNATDKVMDSSVRRFILLLCGVFVTGATVWAASPELAKIRGIYHSELHKINAGYAEAISGFPKQYEQQLTQLERQMQRNGDLNGMLAAQQELKRFQDARKAEIDPFELTPEMPAAAIVKSPAPLRAAQEQYITWHKKEATTKQTRIDSLSRNYLQRLTSLQKDLTIRNRIRDALEVKQEIARLAKGESTDTTDTGTVAYQPPDSTTGTETPPEAIPTYGSVPDWATWDYEGMVNYTQEGYLFGHPDVPNELYSTYQRSQGRGRVHGTCRIDTRVVNMRSRSWFGKAALWKVGDLSKLNGTLVLESKHLARGQAYGPSADLIIYNKTVPIKALTVSLGFRTVSLNLKYNEETRQCTVTWDEGRGISKVIDIPEGATVRLALGITVRNPGEECDTAFSFQ